jgi:hypothetical protein
MPRPVALSDEQMSAIWAAAHPLPPDRRPAFLEAVAVELAQAPIVGDGLLHRIVMRVQRAYFDPPELDSGRMPRISKWDR